MGIAPAVADFQAVVSAVVSIKGAQAAEEWLRGLKTNAPIYSGKGAILRAVNAGKIPTGVIYHYYWWWVADYVVVGDCEKLEPKLRLVPSKLWGWNWSSRRIR